MVAISIHNGIFELLWYWKNRRIEIAHGKIVDPFPFADLFTNLASKLHDLGANECFRKVRELHAGKHFIDQYFRGRDRCAYPAKIRGLAQTANDNECSNRR